MSLPKRAVKIEKGRAVRWSVSAEDKSMSVDRSSNGATRSTDSANPWSMNM